MISPVHFGQLDRDVQDRLRVRTLYHAFTHTDVAIGSVSIGDVVVHDIILVVCVTIGIPFDGGVTMTIGDDDAQGRIIASSNVACDIAGMYLFFPTIRYDDQSGIRIFFPTGLPTQGDGSVLITIA